MSLLSRAKQLLELAVRSGFGRTLGHLRITEAQEEFVKGKMVVSESDCNPHGVLTRRSDLKHCRHRIYTDYYSERQTSWCVC